MASARRGGSVSPAAPSLSSRPAHGAPAGEMAAARNGGNNDADHLGLVATRVTAREAVAQLAEQGPTS